MFSGSFVCSNLLDGPGKAVFPDKSVYTGAFKRGLAEGEGCLEYPDGSKLTGQFRGGKVWRGAEQIPHFFLFITCRAGKRRVRVCGRIAAVAEELLWQVRERESEREVLLISTHSAMWTGGRIRLAKPCLPTAAASRGPLRKACQKKVCEQCVLFFFGLS